MGSPISVRLEDGVRAELETQARLRGVGLASLLRDIAGEAARTARRRRRLTSYDSASAAPEEQPG
jgi:hypothetical protein